MKYWLLLLLLSLQNCNTCRRLPDTPMAQFSISAQVEVYAIVFNENKFVKILITINPQSEVSKKSHYQLINWMLPDGIQGQLFNAQQAPIEDHNKLYNGENVLYYEPLNTGEHIISLNVQDQYHDTQVNVTLDSITVQAKPICPFDISLETASSQSFIHQNIPINLKFSSNEAAASALNYTIETVNVTKGKLYWVQTDAAVTKNNEIPFGEHPLVFKPNGAIGEAVIQITIRNSEGTSRHARLPITIQPISFQPNLWLILATHEEKKRIQEDVVVLEVLLAGIDPALANEKWQMMGFHFSDGVKRQLLDKDLQPLQTFSLQANTRHAFYLPLPDIRLNENPTLTVQIIGPASTAQTVTIELGTIQQNFIHEQKKACLESIENVQQQMAHGLQLPIRGTSAILLQTSDQEATKQINLLENQLKKLQDSYRALDNESLTPLMEHITALKDQQEKIQTLQKTCEKKQYAFQINLEMDTATIFNHQPINLPLALASDEPKASELTYTVQAIEVTKGTLYLANGEAIQPDTQINWGKQNVIFKPTGETGQASIKLIIANNQGEVRQAALTFTIQPVDFQIALQTANQKLFKHQEAIVTLDIASLDLGADGLPYAIEALEVINGTLYSSQDYQPLTVNSAVRFGWQTLVFKPTDDSIDQAIQGLVKLTISNNKGNIHTASLGLTIQPIEFQVNAWLRTVTEPKEQKLTQEIAALAVKLTGIDPDLMDEVWKITEWQFSDGVKRSLLAANDEQLQALPLQTTVTNVCYVPISDIKLDQAPTLRLTVEGPGKTAQEVVLALAPIQTTLIKNKIATYLPATQELIQKIEAVLQLPISGVHETKAKELITHLPVRFVE